MGAREIRITIAINLLKINRKSPAANRVMNILAGEVIRFKYN